jgi:type IV pilus assembly protein PilF
MIDIKHGVIVLLMSMLVACGGTVKQKEEAKRDKHAAVLNAQLASGYIRRGDLEIAEEKLLKAIEFDEKYVPAYTTMAVLKTMIGNIAEAENYYLDALDLDPRNPELHNNYGTFLCDTGKLEEAFEQFDIALKNQFYNTPEAAHANLGYCMLQMKNPDFKKAEKHLRAGLKVNPNLSSALLAMGELGVRSNKYLMARAYMQRYHAKNKPTSYSLWLQIQAEYALGDKLNFVKLSQTLLNAFPESPEAEKVMELSYK